MKSTRKHISLFFFSTVAASGFFAASSSFAAKGYEFLAPLPTNPSSTLTDLSDYMQYLYVLMIGTAIVLAVFMIVLGGIKYVTALVPSSKEDGKKYITDAILGLILALSSYLLLQTLNPKLLTIGLNLPEIQLQVAQTYGDITLATQGTDTVAAGGGAGGIVAGSGACSVSNLSGVFGSGANGMSCICAKESGNDAAIESTVDCIGGGRLASGNFIDCSGKPAFSVGLFQINLTTTDTVKAGWGVDCRQAFNGRNFHATIINQSLYSQCVGLAKNPNNNVSAAKMSYNAGGFKPWSTHTSCGL